MAIFIGARGDNFLACRHVADVAKSLKKMMTGALPGVGAGKELALMHGVKRRLDEEIGFEEQFAADLLASLDALDFADEELFSISERLNRMAADHFARRQSVIAYQEICTLIQDRLLCRIVRLACQWMGENGFTSPSQRFCLFAAEEQGRGEGSIAGVHKWLLIHDNPDEGASPYFSGLVRKAAGMLAQLRPENTGAPACSLRQGTVAEWRFQVNEALAKKPEQWADFIGLADLRLIDGDMALAAEMSEMASGLLVHHYGALRFVGRSVSEMQVGLDFLGRLRVEKNGNYKGKFNVGKLAIEPLVKNVRVMSIKNNVKATNTVERIKRLMEDGQLNVELAERLLSAFHYFTGYSIRLEHEQHDGEPFIDLEELREQDERHLKSGLEAIVNLQRIVYQSFLEQ